MSLFSKKPTPIQEVELQEFARTLYTVRQQCEQAFVDIFFSGTKDLYSLCRQALQEDRDLKPSEYLLDPVRDSWPLHYVHRMPEEIVETGTLIEKAKETIRIYTDFLADMQTEAMSLKPAKWYPKKYRKAYDLWDSYSTRILPFLETAAGALQPPEPLKHDPGHENDKLNLFAYALDSVAMFSHEPFLPADL